MLKLMWSTAMALWRKNLCPARANIYSRLLTRQSTQSSSQLTDAATLQSSIPKPFEDCFVHKENYLSALLFKQDSSCWVSAFNRCHWVVTNWTEPARSWSKIFLTTLSPLLGWRTIMLSFASVLISLTIIDYFKHTLILRPKTCHSLRCLRTVSM